MANRQSPGVLLFQLNDYLAAFFLGIGFQLMKYTNITEYY